MPTTSVVGLFGDVDWTNKTYQWQKSGIKNRKKRFNRFEKILAKFFTKRDTEAI